MAWLRTLPAVRMSGADEIRLATYCFYCFVGRLSIRLSLVFNEGGCVRSGGCDTRDN